MLCLYANAHFDWGWPLAAPRSHVNLRTHSYVSAVGSHACARTLCYQTDAQLITTRMILPTLPVTWEPLPPSIDGDTTSQPPVQWAEYRIYDSVCGLDRAPLNQWESEF